MASLIPLSDLSKYEKTAEAIQKECYPETLERTVKTLKATCSNVRT